MRRMILHIGRHKTGSSAVQRYLSDHRAAYAAEGIIIPELGGYENVEADPADRVAHHRLARDFGAPRVAAAEKRAAWLDALEKAEQGGDTVVLSSEAFQNQTDFSTLRALCRDNYVEVVCYLREYLDYALAAHAQDVKKIGLCVGFYEFERHFNPPLKRFITRWEEFANRCHWRMYDRQKLTGGDVMEDFLAATDLPSFGANPYQSENPRLGGSLLGFKLQANLAGFHSLRLSQALEKYAATKEAYRAPWRVGAEQQLVLRGRSDYNAALTDLLGAPNLRDFSNGSLPYESPTINEEFREILASLTAFPGLRAFPLFAPFQETAR